jgi:enediyne polyketide synthase
MAGLLNLLRAVDAPRLRHVTLLSSIIGLSGMAGNADYAFANAWATQLLQLLEAYYPQVTCRAFAFSIWDEIGMGVRLNSVGSLARLGVRAIKPEEGAQWFAGLMQRLWPGVELAVVGPLGALATARFLEPPSAKSRWLEKLLVFQPGVEAVAEVHLSPQTDPYLKDHNYDGVWLFPAVVGMEAMAQVAAACADSLDIENVPPRLEALRFDRPIVVPPAGRTIYVRAFVDEPTAEGVVRVKVAIESDIAGNRTECFSGYCVWGITSLAWGAARPVSSSALPIDPNELLYGSIYFQGPTFQHIAAFHEVSERHCVARVRVSRPDPEAVSQGSLLLDRWDIRDCFLHAIQICVPQLRLLPVSIESLESRGFAQRDVYLCASERSQEGRDYIYDIDVLDEGGRVIECITGYRCRAVDQFRKDDVLQYVRAIHDLSSKAVRLAAQREADHAAL